MEIGLVFWGPCIIACGTWVDTGNHGGGPGDSTEETPGNPLPLLLGAWAGFEVGRGVSQGDPGSGREQDQATCFLEAKTEAREEKDCYLSATPPAHHAQLLRHSELCASAHLELEPIHGNGGAQALQCEHNQKHV